MYTVGKTIEQVSRTLSDQRRSKEYTRWTREDLLFYLNQGLKEIGAYRPEAFAATYKIPLVPGAVQTAPEGAILEGILSSNGKPVHSADAGLLKAFGAYAVCPSKPEVVNGVVAYAVRSFARDITDPSIFYVSPPVPAGVTAEVEAQANSKPVEYTLADWDIKLAIADKFFNNLVDYVLARAYGMDTESQVSAAKSQRLLQLFYQVMGVKYKIDSARNSGYYHGEVGTGDPRSTL